MYERFWPGVFKHIDAKFARGLQVIQKKLQVIQKKGVVAEYKKCELPIKSTKLKLLLIESAPPRNSQNWGICELLMPVVLHERGMYTRALMVAVYTAVRSEMK